MIKRYLLVLLLGAWVSLALAQTPLPKPGNKTLCPVCGMLVAKYPRWIATIVYQDGHAHHFDGVKDLAKFYLAPAKYVAGHSREQMVKISVTDFYNVQPIDARMAFYVAGSDVLGPMGNELIPLATLAEANDFMKEHKGKHIYRFDQLSAEVLQQLDSGKH